MDSIFHAIVKRNFLKVKCSFASLPKILFWLPVACTRFSPLSITCTCIQPTTCHSVDLFLKIIAGPWHGIAHLLLLCLYLVFFVLLFRIPLLVSQVNPYS